MGTYAEYEVTSIPKPLNKLSEEEIERKRCISKITTYTLNYLTGKLVEEGFEWLLPVIFSKSTDPLWPDPGASIEKYVEAEIYGETVRATLSMIVHKIVACSLAYPKLFVLSPNIRVERRDRCITGMHLYEFTQLDFEVRNASSRDIMRLVEELICGLIAALKRELKDELASLGRYHELKTLEAPFKVYDRKELQLKYGGDWEKKVVAEASAPVWVINIPREFYDYEDFETGRWDNYDLIMPGYGEILSGSRREYEYSKLVKKMERDKIKTGRYRLLLELAEKGKIKPSAGAGIGVERLINWITGAKHIGETQPFPRVPGTVYEL